MRKQKLILMALMCAIIFTGCKKKEPIDLSSLPTTAAVEKETLSESTEAATAATEESTSPADKNSDSKFSIKTDVKSYTDKKVTVEYPEISNMKDSEKQKQVNELIKRNATAIADVYPAGGEGQSLSIKSTVESANLKRIAITYKGEYKGSASGKSTKIFFTNVIDLETAQNLRLLDYTDAYTAAGYIASGDYKAESASGADEKAIKAYLNSADKNTDYYYKKLNNADFFGGYSEQAGAKYTKETWPEIFSYEKQGTIYISVPVSEELGSYTLIKYSPDNK